MHVNAWMLVQPVLHDRVLVRRVVIGNQVQRFVLGRLALDLLEKLQPLGVAVTLLTLRDDLAVQYIERGKQRGRAVSLVVVGHGGRAPLLHGQARLRAVQSLHLALFVAAQHQRVIGWRHVQAHDIFELFDKLGVARDFKAALQMGLQTIGTPVPRDAGGADTQLGRHRARAPVRGRFGRALGGQLHQARHIERDRRCAARQIALVPAR